jgi:hypothetical protein
VSSFKSYENNIYVEYTDNGKGATIEKLNSKWTSKCGKPYPGYKRNNYL